MNFVKIASSISVVIALAGCTGFWKGGYHIESASKDEIYIQYDPMLASQEVLTQVSEQHCAKFGRKPKLVRTKHGGGIVSNKLYYTCVD